MVGRTFSATLQGIEGTLIEIEAAKQRAIPRLHITGLAGEAVRESRDRVCTCLENLGFDVPSSRIVVHLSPADSRKQGSHFDLPIALCTLKAEGLLANARLQRKAFLGELALDGRLKRINGALGLIEALHRSPEIDRIIVPADNGLEAALLRSPKVKLASTLGAVIDYVTGAAPLATPAPCELENSLIESNALDSVLGQALAKRALQISLAGRHHLLFIGPPGVGKSLIASCAPSLLPSLYLEELREVVKNHSQSRCDSFYRGSRPFRSPHHSISASALLGGGSGIVIPGEVTLAHHGILFLDELPEFRRDAIEGIREPLQNGNIHLNRIGKSLTLPARFTLLAAMNPCPCGYSLSKMPRCHCPVEKIQNYRKRISGPILDRIDLSVILGPANHEDLENPSFSHREIQDSILRAWQLQAGRYADSLQVGEKNGDRNLDLKSTIESLDKPERAWVEKAMGSGKLGYRSLSKILKVARTIADLDEREALSLSDLQEAWSLRCPDFLRPA